MLSLPPSVRIFVSTEPADMRRSFDGLMHLVRDVIGEDPFSGHLFVFCSKKGDRIKILVWDRSGFWLWYKRLEEGVFRMPKPEGKKAVEIDAASLAMILEGIDPDRAHRYRRFSRVG